PPRRGPLEFPHQLRANRGRGRLPELRDALEEAADELALVRLECAGAAAGESEPAVELAFYPIGAEAGEWAEMLAAIYTSWAERTGREVTRAAGDVLRLNVTGPGSYALLVHEAGLHRRELPDRRRILARVAVSQQHTTDTSSGNSEQAAAVVRVCSDGARTGV